MFDLLRFVMVGVCFRHDVMILVLIVTTGYLCWRHLDCQSCTKPCQTPVVAPQLAESPEHLGRTGAERCSTWQPWGPTKPSRCCGSELCCSGCTVAARTTQSSPPSLRPTSGGPAGTDTLSAPPHTRCCLATGTTGKHVGENFLGVEGHCRSGWEYSGGFISRNSRDFGSRLISWSEWAAEFRFWKHWHSFKRVKHSHMYTNENHINTDLLLHKQTIFDFWFAALVPSE